MPLIYIFFEQSITRPAIFFEQSITRPAVKVA
jgi:hypothetical protein